LAPSLFVTEDTGDEWDEDALATREELTTAFMMKAGSVQAIWTLLSSPLTFLVFRVELAICSISSRKSQRKQEQNCMMRLRGRSPRESTSLAYTLHPPLSSSPSSPASSHSPSSTACSSTMSTSGTHRQGCETRRVGRLRDRGRQTWPPGRFSLLFELLSPSFVGGRGEFVTRNALWGISTSTRGGTS
jgi:hypothetical protein